MDRLEQAWNFVMNADALERMLITTNYKGEKMIQLDLHRLDCRRAKMLVKNTINLTEGPFHLRIIHGYHGGTALRKLVRKKYENNRIKERVAVPWNPGETYLRIA